MGMAMFISPMGMTVGDAIMRVNRRHFESQLECVVEICVKRCGYERGQWIILPHYQAEMAKAWKMLTRQSLSCNHEMKLWTLNEMN